MKITKESIIEGTRFSIGMPFGLSPSKPERLGRCPSTGSGEKVFSEENIYAIIA